MAVRFPVDMSLFEQTVHTPSLFTLERSMGPESRQILDYCIPVNSHFPVPEMMTALQRSFPRAIRYYPASNEEIAARVSQCFGLDSDCVVMFNGATELLSWLDQLFIHGPVLLPIPTFGRWTDVPRASGRELICYQRSREQDFQIDIDDLIATAARRRAQTVVICNPNNPTGTCLSRSQLLHLLDGLADVPLVVIDESFLEFSDLHPSASVADLPASHENLVVMKSLGKNLGLHGVRLGCSISHSDMAARLRAHVPHWNINAVAQMVLDVLPEYLSRYRASRLRVIADREYLAMKLKDITAIEVFPSQANFVFCRLPSHVDGDRFRQRLLTEHGCLVRHCGNKIGSDSSYQRIVARSTDDTDRLVLAMQLVLRTTS